MQCLQIVEVLGPCLDAGLHQRLLDVLGTLACLCQHPFRAVRHMAARSLAALSTLDPDVVLTLVVEKILPMLGASDCLQMRQGAVEAVASVVDQVALGQFPSTHILFYFIS